MDKIIDLLKKYKNIFILEILNNNTQGQTALRLSLTGDFYFGKKSLVIKAIQSNGQTNQSMIEFLNNKISDS